MNQEQYRLRRLMTALRKRGWLTLTDVANAMDKDADYTSIKGVGPVLGKVLAGLMKAYYEGGV